MKTKQQIKKWLLKNCVDKDGDLFLDGLDFSDFDGDVYIGKMKVKKNLFQDKQRVYGCLMQSDQIVSEELSQDHQEVTHNLYQDHQKVGESLYQNKQKVKKDLHQDKQKVEGTIIQDNIANDEIDKQINTLKKIISALEEQKNKEGEKNENKRRD